MSNYHNPQTWRTETYSKAGLKAKYEHDLVLARIEECRQRLDARLEVAEKRAKARMVACFFRCSAVVAVAYIASELAKWGASR